MAKYVLGVQLAASPDGAVAEAENRRLNQERVSEKAGQHHIDS